MYQKKGFGTFELYLTEQKWQKRCENQQKNSYLIRDVEFILTVEFFLTPKKSYCTISCIFQLKLSRYLIHIFSIFPILDVFKCYMTAYVYFENLTPGIHFNRTRAQFSIH